MNDTSQTNQTPSPNLENLSQGIPEDMKLDQVPTDLQAQPHITTSTVDDLVPERQNVKRGKGLKLFLVFLLLFLLVFGGGGGLVYAIAYDKIDIGNKDMQRSVAHFVQDLPFAPKTPKYVLEKTYQVSKDIKSLSFGASLAFGSGSFSLLGLGNIDMQFVGDIDISEPDNMKTKINMSVIKEFDMDLVGLGDKTYVRVNKVPALLLNFIGIPTDQITPFLGSWVELSSQDLLATSPGEANFSPTTVTDADLVKRLEVILEDKVLESVVMSEEELGGRKSYKLHFAPSSELLDYIVAKLDEISGETASSVTGTKVSDYVKDVTFDMWIDAQTFFDTKVSLSAVFDTGSNSTSDGAFYDNPLSMLGNTQQFDVAFVMLLSNHGKSFDITAPAGAKSLEDFLQEFQTSVMPDYLQPEDQFSGNSLSI